MIAFDWNSFIFGFLIGSVGMQFFFFGGENAQRKNIRIILPAAAKAAAVYLSRGKSANAWLLWRRNAKSNFRRRKRNEL